MGFFADRLAMAAEEQQQPLRQPTIPQAPPQTDNSADDLIARAKAATAEMRPGTLEELGITPGQDFAPVLSRRHAPAEADRGLPVGLTAEEYQKAQDKSLSLDEYTTLRSRLGLTAEADDELTPQQRGMLEKLGRENGEYGPHNARAKDARDNAALVAELAKVGTWRTSEDKTPRRVKPGPTAGHSYER
jgi:hypothetical protein